MEEIKKLVAVLNDSKLKITMQDKALVVESREGDKVTAKHTIKLRPTNIDGIEEWKFVARKSNRV